MLRTKTHTEKHSKIVKKTEKILIYFSKLVHLLPRSSSSSDGLDHNGDVGDEEAVERDEEALGEVDVAAGREVDVVELADEERDLLGQLGARLLHPQVGQQDVLRGRGRVCVG